MKKVKILQIKNIISKKLNKNEGFSLTEVLACTIIMMFATTILTQTITLGVRHFDTQVSMSKADILCDTLAYTLREKLSYVYKYDSAGKKYYSTSTTEEFSASMDKEYVPFTVENDNGKIYLNYGDGGKAYLAGSACYFDGEFDAVCTVTPKIVEVPDQLLDTSNKKIVENFDVKITVNSKKKPKISEISFIVYPFESDVTVIK